jgi:hypothetical protein
MELTERIAGRVAELADFSELGHGLDMTKSGSRCLRSSGCLTGSDGGVADDVAEGGQAEAGGLGVPGGDGAELGEFGVSGSEADFKSFGFSCPAVVFGFGDAVLEVHADRFEPGTLGGIDPEQRAAEQLCSWMQLVP